MFCPHCGLEMVADLKYCKRCGGPNPLALAQAHEMRPVVSTGLAWAAGGTTAVVAIIGIGLTVASLIDMAHAGLPPWALVWIALFCVLTVFGCVGLLLWFWTRLLGASRAPAAAAPPALRTADTNELSAHHQGALPESRFPSVTEHTTRTLENVKSKQ
ncbi:MAG TPA: hypothetical protein VK422_06150 [Pyrinomonadaceae bacterium]|nr:hypothetical protein [Pyrinomonadaceae bacterium]